jgi:hypothetical protein
MAGIPLSKKIQNELQKDNGQYVLKPAVGKCIVILINLLT